MYSLIRSLQTKRLMAMQVVALGASLIFAEIFYKFHSFLLESIAFLVTWYILDFLIQTLASFMKTKEELLTHTGRPRGG